MRTYGCSRTATRAGEGQAAAQQRSPLSQSRRRWSEGLLKACAVGGHAWALTCVHCHHGTAVLPRELLSQNSDCVHVMFSLTSSRQESGQSKVKHRCLCDGLLPGALSLHARACTPTSLLPCRWIHSQRMSPLRVSALVCMPHCMCPYPPLQCAPPTALQPCHCWLRHCLGCHPLPPCRGTRQDGLLHRDKAI